MWFLLVANAYATCLNVAVSPSTCAAGQAVQVTVDCDGEPLPERWDVELQQDGGEYGALVELGALVDGVAEGVCVDPGIPCDGSQTSFLYAVATDGDGAQDWAFARLLVRAPACASAGTHAPEGDDDADASLSGPEGEVELGAARAEEDPEAAGCGAGGGGGLMSAGLLLLGLRGRRTPRSTPGR